MTDNDHIENWKIRKLIKRLSSIRGESTSMITLIIKAGSQISQHRQSLTDEIGKASNIKSRVNRQSVQDALSSTIYKLKSYNQTPTNGLIIYCGNAISEIDGKEKRICIDIVPSKPMKSGTYFCGNRFDVEPLRELTVTSDSYSFIIIDGNGVLLATVKGNVKTIHFKKQVDLPHKGRRGGQSALRFSRLADEAYQNYITKVNEHIKKYFTKDNLPTTKGLIVAGSASFKNKLIADSTFPSVLKSKILGVLDIAYGMDNGLSNAIELSEEILKNTKLGEEKQIISRFFEEIAVDSGKTCYGIKEILYGLDMGAVDTVILWEDLPLMRYEFDNGEVMFVNPDNEKELQILRDCGKTIKDEQLMSEWLVENYKSLGVDKCSLVTNSSSQGVQFTNGFGGLGALLRWKLDFTHNNEHTQNKTKEDDNIDLNDFDLGDDYGFGYEDDFI